MRCSQCVGRSHEVNHRVATIAIAVPLGVWRGFWEAFRLWAGLFCADGAVWRPVVCLTQ